MTETQVVVGVFTDQTAARQAIDELRRAGYSEQEIGFLTRAGAEDTPEAASSRVVNHATGGGIIGGVLGAATALLIPGIGPAVAGGVLAATLGGVVLGAAAGGLIGTFTGMGIEEQDAQFYQQELEAGRTIVTIKSSTSLDEALAILRRNGAYDAKTHVAEINASAPLRAYGQSEPPDTDEPGPGPTINASSLTEILSPGV